MLHRYGRPSDTRVLGAGLRTPGLPLGFLGAFSATRKRDRSQESARANIPRPPGSTLIIVDRSCSGRRPKTLKVSGLSTRVSGRGEPVLLSADSRSFKKALRNLRDREGTFERDENGERGPRGSGPETGQIGQPSYPSRMPFYPPAVISSARWAFVSWVKFARVSC